MDKIKFDCNGHCAPAYTCSKPGDNSGMYVRSDYAEYLLFVLKAIVDDLPSQRDWLDPQLERMAKKLCKKETGNDEQS